MRNVEIGNLDVEYGLSAGGERFGLAVKQIPAVVDRRRYSGLNRCFDMVRVILDKREGDIQVSDGVICLLWPVEKIDAAVHDLDVIE